MNSERLNTNHDSGNSRWTMVDNYPPFENKISEDNKKLEEDQKYYEAFDRFRFDGHAIFSDIDGTITDNSGEIDGRSVSEIKKYIEAGGTFVPVTGRARFESVKGIVEELDLPFIIINNGAEIFNRQGERIYGSEIPEEQVRDAFSIADKYGLTWMQNKKNPATGEEYLYSNFTEDSERAMKAVGIKDTVHNEEERIGLSAKKVSAEEVMAIPGQNYKIQMMSSNPDAVQLAYDEFRALGIPCMLNMQSDITGRFHWVEVIQGTKISGIQKLIDDFLPNDVTTARVVGDGGNDLTMFKELHNKKGEPIENIYTAVANACSELKEKSHEILKSSYDAGPRGLKKGGAMGEIIEEESRMRGVEQAVNLANKLLDEKLVDETGLMERIQKIKNAGNDLIDNQDIRPVS